MVSILESWTMKVTMMVRSPACHTMHGTENHDKSISISGMKNVLLWELFDNVPWDQKRVLLSVVLVQFVYSQLTSFFLYCCPPFHGSPAFLMDCARGRVATTCVERS